MNRSALILCGGAAQGAIMANIARHILVEKKVPLKILSGVSSGSITAAALSFTDPDEVVKVWTSIKGMKDVFEFNYFSFWRKNGLCNLNPLKKLIAPHFTGEPKRESVIFVLDKESGIAQPFSSHDFLSPSYYMEEVLNSVRIGALIENSGKLDAGPVLLAPLGEMIVRGMTDLHVVCGTDPFVAPAFYSPTPIPVINEAFYNLQMFLYSGLRKDLEKVVSKNSRPGYKQIKVTLYHAVGEVYNSFDFSSCPKAESIPFIERKVTV